MAINTKTMNKAMKISSYLCITALTMAGAMTTACSSEDRFAEQLQQQPSTKTITLKTTVSLDSDNAITRALTLDTEHELLAKTFAAGNQIAVGYNNVTNKAVSEPLTADDISADGKSATFTVTLNNLGSNPYVNITYPATMADEKGKAKSAPTTQDGTLESIAKNYDLATSFVQLTEDGVLPPVTLENQFAICAYTIKDETGNTDLTNTITRMDISAQKEGERDAYKYTINRTPASGPIYVVMNRFYGYDIEYAATDGTKHYTKSVTNKSYEAGNFYQLGLRMAETTSTTTLTDALTDGATVTIAFNYGIYNTCTFTFNNGSFTFVSGTGWGGSNEEHAKEMTVTGNGNIVFRQNRSGTIDDRWKDYGFQVILNPSFNTYETWAGEEAINELQPSFQGIQVNGQDITYQLTKSISIDDLVKEEGQSWADIVNNNSDKIYSDRLYIRRVSDNYYLKRDNGSSHNPSFAPVILREFYSASNTYIFEENQ